MKRRIINYQFFPTNLMEPETLAFITRVENDGGKILDVNKLNSFYKVNKEIGKYQALEFAVSKQFGYKLNASGNIIKIYDASKNGNDLEIAGGSVPELPENSMFFLNNSFLKDDSVKMDIIGGKWTCTTKVNVPNIANTIHYIFAIGNIWFWAGGTQSTYQNPAYTINPQIGSHRGGIGTYNASQDNNINRVVDYRYTADTNFSIIRKDGENVGESFNSMNNTIIDFPFTYLKYGIRGDEVSNLDADCYLNDTFFYNDFLTDSELQKVNSL